MIPIYGMISGAVSENTTISRNELKTSNAFLDTLPPFKLPNDYKLPPKKGKARIEMLLNLIINRFLVKSL